ncbi:S8 family peptidase [Arthrobacter sp. 35W]|uniref:S8 family peptidase n=1 Tax=Arthrobacter sp. 35W TaxID=1132441 RepID=UPI0004143947|nr:S8 family serine peptidase [Arthrobacter sp. 35W]
MSKHHHRARTRVLAVLTGLALAATAAGTAVADDSSDALPLAQGFTKTTAPLSLAPAQKYGGNLADAAGPISVFVQFQGQGAFDATQPQSVKDDPTAATVDASAAVKQIRAGIESTAAAVTSAAAGTTLYTTTNTIPGAGITADAASIRELAKRTDVVKITPIVPKRYANGSTDIDTKALSAWTQNHATGAKATIAVIDTGIDYTHTDFGGPGTAAAYAAAKASNTLVPGTYDPAKFAGGYDLVGDSYNADPAAGPGYQPVPAPDANPLDCTGAGHGTHVAGTAAGYGVKADGTTFTGDYGTLDEAAVNAMRIGPGSAPMAKLVSLRVFGCAGSSDVVGNALDKVLDPNGDGVFDDRANIVNMSLGSDGSPTDDPENAIVDNLTKQGVLSVVASGNAGDTHDIGGSPGNAKTSLTVANSVGSKAAVDRIDVLAPADKVGSVAGQYSASFNYSASTVTPAQLTGTVQFVPGVDQSGCTALTPEQAAAVAGKWAMFSWDDNDATRRCGSAARFNNAQAAGAVGVVFTSQRTVFEAGIAGNATIPGVQFNKAATDALTAAAKAGTLQIKLDPAWQGTATAATGALDSLNSSSSRGVHGSNGIVKPDVAAPGTSIASAGVGSGSGVAVKSGTSMATPHVAGIAALLYSAAAEAGAKNSPITIKTIIMNTANVDVLANGVAYGPNRVGSGRVNASDALNSQVLAYAADDADLVSVNFGVVEVGSKSVSLSRKITLKNRGAAATYAASYLPATTMPGVAYTVSPSSVKVPANGTAKVTVTMSIADPTALAKTLDPTMSAAMLGLPRQFLADASGRVQFASAGNPTLRVPVYTAPKPASDMSVGNISFSSTGTTTTAKLTGRGVNQGSGAANYTSLVAPFVLGATSGELPGTDKAPLTNKSMDLQYVGASTTVPAIAKAGGNVAADGMVNFGIATYGNWAALLTTTAFGVEIDTTGDGNPDFVVQTGMVDNLDAVVVTTYSVATGQPVDMEFANGVLGNTDTNTFDTNVLTLPVLAGALGLDLSKPAPISYKVVSYSQYNFNSANVNTPVVEETAAIPFDVVAPALWFDGNGASGLFVDAPGTALQVNRAAGAKDAKALFLHLHNASGEKAQVVSATVSNGNGNGGGNGNGNGNGGGNGNGNGNGHGKPRVAG